MCFIAFMFLAVRMHGQTDKRSLKAPPICSTPVTMPFFVIRQALSLMWRLSSGSVFFEKPVPAIAIKACS